METIENIARRWERSRWAAAAVAVLVLLIVGITIGWGALRLRQTLQARIVGRDGEILGAITRFGMTGAQGRDSLAERLESADGQFEVALRLSELKEGVLAVRLYDAEGEMVVALPVSAREARLDAHTLSSLRSSLRALSRYESSARLSDYFWFEAGKAGSEAEAPVQLVLIPLQAATEKRLLAVAELLMDGSSVAREFSALDRSLAVQAGTAFLGSAVIILLALGWAFRRLEKVNLQLEKQASELRRANQELALAAKSSALGAVAAHFVHGLASPLTGLQSFVNAHADQDEAGQEALRGAQRMQSLIGEMVRLLTDNPAEATYEMPLRELPEVLVSKLEAAAREREVRLTWECQSPAAVNGRDANLMLLVLENLMENAIQASPQGGVVRLGIRPAGERIRCEVEDHGPGLPEAVRQNLFLAGRRGRAGGHGLGLAISHQLARHLGGELYLGRTGPEGTVFVLEIPHALEPGASRASRECVMPG